MKKINEVYVFVSDEGKGEGIIGMTTEMPGFEEEVFMPFVCSDKERMELLKATAIKIGIISQTTIKLIKLTHREELEVFEIGGRINER